MNDSQEIDYFYGLSVLLTGYDEVVLYASGQGETYFKTVRRILGKQLMTQLLSEFQVILEQSKGNSKKLHTLLKKEMLKDAKWGPVCRNIIQLWYMGNWYEMPTEWQENYVSSTEDTTHVVSASSYIEGLVWKAMGQHPKSAKQPGYHTWAVPPN
ncbi:hypothetical protein POV27_08470 [Aureisphaera galaxeae]|uniref:hypothetical protein n=1 Tax=Aureisphaera galaxeae TaxID=1538023 RepID=UPI0023503A6B|nr:hypothetical protein [Aureisphaera galaxeae]MDC8004085.1 hypothetical protein [Aureisphaera galaxeae]